MQYCLLSFYAHRSDLSPKTVFITTFQLCLLFRFVFKVLFPLPIKPFSALTSFFVERLSLENAAQRRRSGCARVVKYFRSCSRSSYVKKIYSELIDCDQKRDRNLIREFGWFNGFINWIPPESIICLDTNFLGLFKALSGKWKVFNHFLKSFYRFRPLVFVLSNLWLCKFIPQTKSSFHFVKTTKIKNTKPIVLLSTFV